MVIGDTDIRSCTSINSEVMRCLIALIQMTMAAEIMSKDEHRVIPASKTVRVTNDVMG
jgi:hypothetical protein